MLIVATAGGSLLARKSLEPVSAIAEQAARIGATSLHERVAVRNPRDELGRLASVLNDLLERLDRSFDEQRRFMADASHELRTPVAIISGEAELALSRDRRSPEELRDALERVRGETRPPEADRRRPLPARARRSGRSDHGGARGLPRRSGGGLGACRSLARGAEDTSRSRSPEAKTSRFAATRRCCVACSSTCSTTPSSTRLPAVM